MTIYQTIVSEEGRRRQKRDDVRLREKATFGTSRSVSVGWRKMEAMLNHERIKARGGETDQEGGIDKKRKQQSARGLSPAPGRRRVSESRPDQFRGPEWDSGGNGTLAHLCSVSVSVCPQRLNHCPPLLPSTPPTLSVLSALSSSASSHQGRPSAMWPRWLHHQSGPRQ